MAFSFQCQFHLEARREGKAALPACRGLCPAMPAPWYQTRLLPRAHKLAPPPQNEPGWGERVSAGALQAPDSEQKRVDLPLLFPAFVGKRGDGGGESAAAWGWGGARGRPERGHPLQARGGLGLRPGQKQNCCAMETVHTDASAFSGWEGLGLLFKVLLSSTNTCTRLMPVGEEARLPGSSVVQLGGGGTIGGGEILSVPAGRLQRRLSVTNPW